MKNAIKIFQCGMLTCSPTGMFALPNPVSHVSSAAFAQARPRLGSGLLTPIIRYGLDKTNLTRNYTSSLINLLGSPVTALFICL
jgi:hypothetical protein